MANIATVAIVAALIAGASGFVLWIALGRPTLAPSTHAGLTTSDVFDGIKIALTVVGGIGGVVALVIAYRKQRYAEQDHIREDTKLYTDRFRAASEQLGSDRSAIRLAGVYTMASLADDWAKGRQTCIDVLCAYLRMPYSPPDDTAPRADPTAADGDTDERQGYEERQVRHTLVSLIGAHLRPDAATSWQGHDFDFTGATFDGGNLSGAVFSDGRVSFGRAAFSGGHVDFGGATFSGAHVDFVLATFSGGEVYFGGATFSGSGVYFGGAKFSSGRVYFSSAAFSGGEVSFGDAMFSGGEVYFGGAMFSGGRVYFGGAKFSGGKVYFGGAKFSGSGVSFGGATFSGGHVDFVLAAFSGGEIYFGGATFSGGRVYFDDATFTEAYATLTGMLGLAGGDPLPPGVRYVAGKTVGTAQGD
jgi:uncharacterized protein YjbI with pentapeptide repeats